MMMDCAQVMGRFRELRFILHSDIVNAMLHTNAARGERKEASGSMKHVFKWTAGGPEAARSTLHPPSELQLWEEVLGYHDIQSTRTGQDRTSSDLLDSSPEESRTLLSLLSLLGWVRGQTACCSDSHPQTL